MSAMIERKTSFPFANLLLALAVGGVILGLTGKTVYDVMAVLRNASAANYYYREAFRLQAGWRLAISRIGPIKSCSANRVVGSYGQITLEKGEAWLDVGGKRCPLAIPDDFVLTPSLDTSSGLAVLMVSRRGCAEAPLRLAAVIAKEEMHEKK